MEQINKYLDLPLEDIESMANEVLATYLEAKKSKDVKLPYFEQLGGAEELLAELSFVIRDDKRRLIIIKHLSLRIGQRHPEDHLNPFEAHKFPSDESSIKAMALELFSDYRSGGQSSLARQLCIEDRLASIISAASQNGRLDMHRFEAWLKMHVKEFNKLIDSEDPMDLEDERAERREAFHKALLARKGKKALRTAAACVLAASTGAVVMDRFLYERGLDRSHERIADIAQEQLNMRDWEMTPEDIQEMPSLDGAKLTFTCAALPTGTPDVYQWEPVKVEEMWDHSSLESSYFGVEFIDGEDRRVSIARAGWGPSLELTPSQLASPLPKILETEAVRSNEGEVLSYVIPVSGFVEDPAGVANFKFTDGERAADGFRRSYFVVQADGGLACNGDYAFSDANGFAPAPKKMTGTLKLHPTRLSMADLYPNKDMNFAKDYRDAYARFSPELAQWYVDNYDNFILAADSAIMNASQYGVEEAKLKAFADYFVNRTFEKQLLTLFEQMEERGGPEMAERAAQRMSQTYVPIMNIKEVENLVEPGMEFYPDGVAKTQVLDHLPNKQGLLYISADELGSARMNKTLAHEIFGHLFLQYPHSTVQADLPFRKEVNLGHAGDAPFMEGGAEVIALMATDPERLDRNIGLASEGPYLPETRFLQILMDAGYEVDVLSYSINDTDRTLTQEDVDLLYELGLNAPDRKSPLAAMYSLLLDATGASSEVETKRLEKLEDFFTLLQVLQEEGAKNSYTTNERAALLWSINDQLEELVIEY